MVAINLIPGQQWFRIRARLRWRKLLLLTIGVSLGGILLWQLRVSYQLKHMLLQLKRLQQQVVLTNKQLSQRSRAGLPAPQVAQIAVTVKALTHKVQELSTLLLRLEQSMVPPSYLQHILVQENRVKLIGETLTGREVINIVTSLTQHDHSGAVGLVKLEKVTTGYRFELLVMMQ